MKGIRIDFEGASSHHIEVDPYRRSTKYNPTKPNPVKISAVTFSGRSRTGVDLPWRNQQGYRDLSSDQKDELTPRQGSNEGKASIKKQRTINSKKQKNDPDNADKENWQKKSMKAINTQSVLVSGTRT